MLAHPSADLSAFVSPCQPVGSSDRSTLSPGVETPIHETNRPRLRPMMFLLSNLGTNAQANKAPGDDSSTVRETVRNYIEGYYTGDARRMGATLHPHYLKHVLHGNIPVREKTGNQMLSEVRSNGPVESSSGRPNRTDQRPGHLGKHGIRQARHSALGRLHDAFEVGWRMEDSLCRSADRRLTRIPNLQNCGPRAVSDEWRIGTTPSCLNQRAAGPRGTHSCRQIPRQRHRADRRYDETKSVQFLRQLL